MTTRGDKIEYRALGRSHEEWWPATILSIRPEPDLVDLEVHLPGTDGTLTLHNIARGTDPGNWREP